METQIKTSGVKDFFINLGATIALYTLVVSLLNLLFVVIDRAYPRVFTEYSYFGSTSISWPVSVLIIFFPILMFLMWLMERGYKNDPESKNRGIHKWLVYITLFISGLTAAIDLVTVLYYFIDGQELTTGFLLKVLVVLVMSVSIFTYYISDLRNTLKSKSRMGWRIFAGVIVITSIIWGFAVLGSPRTQRLYKYDEQKVSDLQNISSQVANYFYDKKNLPKNLEESFGGNYYVPVLDQQNNKPYEYKKTSENTYELCAEFNKEINEESAKDSAYLNNSYYGGSASWAHSAGRYCFTRTLNLNNSDATLYPKSVPFQ
ncbi:MAG: DUF5671 domain-containing protein [Patescibacteria group bacterium]